MGSPSLQPRSSKWAFTSSNPPTATTSPALGRSPAAMLDTGVVRCRTTSANVTPSIPRASSPALCPST